MESKRAQNLEIIFSGDKDRAIKHLIQALFSVTEPEYFSHAKMSTLKRYLNILYHNFHIYYFIRQSERHFCLYNYKIEFYFDLLHKIQLYCMLTDMSQFNK